MTYSVFEGRKILKDSQVNTVHKIPKRNESSKSPKTFKTLKFYNMLPYCYIISKSSEKNVLIGDVNSCLKVVLGAPGMNLP